MDIQDLLDNPKALALGGAALGIFVVTAMRRGGGLTGSGSQTVEIEPAGGLSWQEVAGRANLGDGTMATVPGMPGQSAYDLWRNKPENQNKSLDDFFASLRGATGSTGAAGPKGDKGDPGTILKPAPTPTPAKPKPTTPAPAKPVPGWEPKYPGEIDPRGKPYSCPTGYYMTTERGAPSNHVCQVKGGTKQIQVVYNKPPTARYPAKGGDASVASPETGHVAHAHSHNYGKGGEAESTKRHHETCGCGKCRGQLFVVGRNPQPFGGVAGFTPVPEPISFQPWTFVQTGETWQRISNRVYGTPNHAGRLQILNPEIGRLRSGQRVRV